MHPEEHRFTHPFFSQAAHGTRYFLAPHLANIPDDYALACPNFTTNILSHDIEHNGKTVLPMFLGKNKDPIAILKEAVFHNKVTILEFVGDAVQHLFEDDSYKKPSYVERVIHQSFESPNFKREIPRTSLDKFHAEMVATPFETSNGHGLALVGFDDSLYQDYKTKGGFILKGTWDDTAYEYASIPYQFILDFVELNKKRHLESARLDKSGPAIFLLRMQTLDLSKEFEEKLFALYQKYKDEDDFQILHFPYLLSIFKSREQIEGFEKLVGGDTDLDSLSQAEINQIRSEIISLLNPWTFLNVAVVSGFENLKAIMQDDKLISHSYRPQTTDSIFPEWHEKAFLERRGESMSYVSQTPHDLEFWRGFSAFSTACLKVLDDWEKQQEAKKSDEL